MKYGEKKEMRYGEEKEMKQGFRRSGSQVQLQVLQVLEVSYLQGSGPSSNHSRLSLESLSPNSGNPPGTSNSPSSRRTLGENGEVVVVVFGTFLDESGVDGNSKGFEGGEGSVGDASRTTSRPSDSRAPVARPRGERARGGVGCERRDSELE